MNPVYPLNRDENSSPHHRDQNHH